MSNKNESAKRLTETEKYKRILQEAAQYAKEWPELPVPVSNIVGLSNIPGLLKDIGSVKIESRECVSVTRKSAWKNIPLLHPPKVQYPTATRRVHRDGANDDDPVLESVEQYQNDVRRNKLGRIDTAQLLRSLDLDPALMEWLERKHYILSGTVQRALKLLISDPTVNLIVQSPKHSGQDAARLISMLHSIDLTKMYPQVICIFPAEHLGSLKDGKLIWEYCVDVEVRVAYSRVQVDPHKCITQQILLSTPSNAIQLGLENKAFDLNKISLFIVSKADKVISTQEGQNETLKIYEHLNPSCQVLFLSDTYEQEYMDYVEYVVENPVIFMDRFH